MIIAMDMSDKRELDMENKMLNLDGLDIVGFDNVSYEQMMLEKEAKLEDDRKRDEEDFWNQFEEESLDFT